MFAPNGEGALARGVHSRKKCGLDLSLEKIAALKDEDIESFKEILMAHLEAKGKTREAKIAVARRKISTGVARATSRRFFERLALLPMEASPE